MTHQLRVAALSVLLLVLETVYTGSAQAQSSEKTRSKARKAEPPAPPVTCPVNVSGFEPGEGCRFDLVLKAGEPPRTGSLALLRGLYRVELEHRLVKDGWYGYLHYDLRVWQDGQVNLTARSGGEDGVAALEGETVSRVAFTAGMHAAASGCTSSLLTDGQTASCPRQEQDSIAAHVRTSPPTNGFTRISIRQLSANPHASP